MLEIKRLSAGYGDVQVLSDIDLAIAAGEIVALIGPNGAGKTTLLSTISGLVRAKNGEVRLEGRDLANRGTEEIVLAGISQVPEGRRLFAGMTVRENLLVGAYTRKDRSAVARDLQWMQDLFPPVAKRIDQLAGSLSGGEQQMVAIGRGLMARPKLLMIDELSLGLAPVIIDSLFDVLREVSSQGITLFIVEQDVQSALEIASRGYVLELGRITRSGPSKELLADEYVRKAYLGL